MARREQVAIGVITMVGVLTKVGTHTIRILARDHEENIMLCSGSDKPEDGDAGFATGCKFTQSNGTIYHNAGDAKSAKFQYDLSSEPGVLSFPPSGMSKVKNLYVDPVSGKFMVEYEV
ncbi:MAG: hypothetical protein O8C67_06065 [Candidatus Methanoperedens sp.]|nr:hypothetical protein [Candidatus Methanoperedens sp.]